jgi:hypothetical protein
MNEIVFITGNPITCSFLRSSFLEAGIWVHLLKKCLPMDPAKNKGSRIGQGKELSNGVDSVQV